MPMIIIITEQYLSDALLPSAVCSLFWVQAEWNRVNEVAQECLVQEKTWGSLQRYTLLQGEVLASDWTSWEGSCFEEDMMKWFQCGYFVLFVFSQLMKVHFQTGFTGCTPSIVGCCLVQCVYVCKHVCACVWVFAKSRVPKYSFY